MVTNSVSPKFSLLVPCYNAEKYIEKFLENISVLNRPFDEVIFYDDASTDNTIKVLEAHGLRVIKGLQNRGPGYARNQLVKQTSCEWFHFHDIDDGLRPDYLVKTAAIAQKDITDVVLCNVYWYDENSGKLLIKWEYANNLISENPFAYTLANPIGGINGLYRKTKFDETVGFNTAVRIWEDADFHVKLAAAGARFYVIEEELSFSIRYADSLSTNQLLGWVTRLALLQEYAEQFKQKAEREEIGKQAQVAAGNLILLHDVKAARKAYELSEACGVKVPYNKSKIWELIKTITPKFLRIELRLLHLKMAFGRGT